MRRVRLTPEAFALAARDAGLRPESVGRARRVLVDGDRVTDVARDCGVRSHGVSQTVGRVIRAALQLGPCPMCGHIRE